MAWLGDVNGDGVADFAAGAYCMHAKMLRDNPLVPDDQEVELLPGSVQVYSGKDARVLGRIGHDDTDFTFGEQVLGPGDMDGDQVPDLVVFASHAPGASLLRILTIGVPSGRGIIYAYSGKTQKLLWKVRTDQSLLEGSRCGDVDRDGRADLVVCSFGEEEEKPELALRSGRHGQTLWHRSLPRPATFTEGGDLDGDGAPEILVGQPRSSSERTGEGEVILLSGKDGRELWKAHSPRNAAGFGDAVCAIGDVNADTSIDFAVGEAGRYDGMKSFLCLLSGKDGTTLREVELDPDMRWLRAMTSVSDADTDGLRDVAISWKRQIQVLSSKAGNVLLNTQGHEMDGGRVAGSAGEALLLVGDPVHPEVKKSRGIVSVIPCTGSAEKK